MGSLCFLDVEHCFAKTVVNVVLKTWSASNSRGDGNTAWDGDCEVVGKDTFQYLATILTFSPWFLGPQIGHLQRLLSRIALAKVEHLIVRNRVLILMWFLATNTSKSVPIICHFGFGPCPPICLLHDFFVFFCNR